MKNRILALAIATGFAVILNACNTTTPQVQDPQIDQNTTIQQDQDAFISAVDPFVKVGAKGQFVLSDQASKSLSVENVARADEYLKAVNEQIASGLLIANSDASLSLPGAGLTTLANSNGWKLYWWGFRLALDATKTRRLTAALAGGASASALISLIPFPPTAVGAKIVAAILGIGAGAISFCNAPGYGVYIYRSWVGTSWCRSQPR
jgi:hypothetical protein